MHAGCHIEASYVGGKIALSYTGNSMRFMKIIRTNDDHLLTLLRVTLGLVFFAHGAQKALGWFGGSGFEQTMKGFTHGLGIPALFALLAIAAEFLGGIGLIVGLLSRLAAFGVAVNMIALKEFRYCAGIMLQAACACTAVRPHWSK